MKLKRGGDGPRFLRFLNDMQRFFFDDEIIENNMFSVNGEKYNHIIRSLRLGVGENVVFCDGKFYDYECKLIAYDDRHASFEIVQKYLNRTEPELRITVYQCLAKGDKLDDMVKRCVQFGVHKIVPVLSKRCVSRPDSKSAAKKTERLNKIARSSAMQSMRGYIPRVSDIIDYEQAIAQMKRYQTSFVCYENENYKSIIIPGHKKDEVAFLIGPEGGLDESEVEYAKKNGIPCVTLGKRILRTEDAASFIIPILLYNIENL